MFVKYSPKDIRELILCYLNNVQSKSLPEDLESFFISWMNRMPQKSLSLVKSFQSFGALFVIDNYYTNIDDEKKIIEKYIKLGVLKKFKVTDYKNNELV